MKAKSKEKGSVDIPTETFSTASGNQVSSTAGVKCNIQYAHGDIYKREWKGGSKHGTGKLAHANGNVYDGEFRDGMKSGKGKQVYANGDRYNGKWRQNLENGKGEKHYAMMILKMLDTGEER